MIRLFKALERADVVTIHSMEVDSWVIDQNFFAGPPRELARLVLGDEDYFFEDQDIELSSEGEATCLACAEDDPDTYEEVLTFMMVAPMQEEDVLKEEL